MTKPEKIEEIRRAVIAVNPEIAGTCSGCGKTNPQKSDQCELKGLDHVNVHPRSVRLADVLLALQKHKAQSAIQDYGCFMLYREEESTESIEWHEISPSSLKRVHWNLLRDSLEDQDEPTINFIHELITK